MKTGMICVKVMCILEHDGKLLVGKGYDDVKNEHFGRLMGGTVEFGETTDTAIRREIREELGCELENPRFLEVSENIFDYKGQPGHEICFIYEADLANKELYNSPTIRVVEKTYEFEAAWIPIQDFAEDKLKLYPNGKYQQELFNRRQYSP